MLERVRSWVDHRAGLGRRDDLIPERRMTRREKELRQRRLLYIGTGIAAAVVIIALIVGAVYQYFLFPRETFATVNEVEIQREEYVKYRKFDLLQQITQLQNQLQTASADQQPQIQQQLQTAQLEYEDLQDDDDADIDPATLRTMVENQLVLQGLDEFGITISEQEIDDYVLGLFAPAPLTDPTVTPTTEPTAEAWATQTFESFVEQATQTAEASETAAQQTIEAQPTGEQDETPEADGTEAAPPEATEPAEADDADATEPADATEEPGTPEAEPTADATAEGTPAETPEPSPTPNREEARATGEASLDLLDQNFLDRADMSREDFEELVAKPQLARQRIREHLNEDIPARAEQVHAAQIVVATRDAAEELINGRLQEEEFSAVAEEVSTDQQTAQDGGDMGWFPRGVMAPAVEEAAFSQEVGTISQEPIQTESGWHIIKVLERQEDRPLTVTMLNRLRQENFERWMDQQWEEADISSEVPLPEEQGNPQLQQGF